MDTGRVEAGQIIVFGVSTSEVRGKHIGTAGAREIAAVIYEGVEIAQSRFGFYAAFQCCEHLNRALVVEKEALERYRLEQVGAVPVPKAGGSMASYAYRRLKQPCLAETIQAHAGIDIGSTLIGMHLRRVAVPYRPNLRYFGEAHVTAAVTRPKLIGGERAEYTLEQVQSNSETCR